MRRVRLFFLAFALTLIPTVVPVWAAGPIGPPQPPPGFKHQTTAQGVEAVEEEIVNLSPEACAGNDMAVDCKLLHRSSGGSHLALPAGTQRTGRSLFSDHVVFAADYWYWYRWDEFCSIYGCWYMGYRQDEDGIANGDNVYKWNHGCTPEGLNTYADWCGDLYDGGGWPYYAMQFGFNGHTCVISSYTVCVNHGMRRWIDVWGNPGGYSYW